MSIFKFSFKEGSNDKTSGCNTMKLFDIIASIELCNFVPILQTNANRYDYQNFEIYNYKISNRIQFLTFILVITLLII